MSTLAALVGDVGRFADEVWGARPLRTGEPGSPVVAPLTLADLDRVVTSAARLPSVRLVRRGERVAPSRFCSPTRIGSTTLHDVVDARKVLDEFRRGATIVLQSLHRTWAPMSAWCAGLEAELGWPVQCNAYLTPGDTRGLRRHADGHDVFVVQVEGNKSWNVAGLGSFDLAPGEVLYLPAGVEHDAATHRHASLHVTLGVHRPTTVSLARAVFDDLEVTAPPVPIGPDASLAPTLSAVIGGSATALAAAEVHRIERTLRRSPRSHPGGIIERSVRQGEIHEASWIELVPHDGAVVDIVGDRLRCTWSGGSLSMPLHLRPAIERIVGHGVAAGRPLRVGDLPGLDAAGRTVLVRRLIDEGLVVVTTADVSPTQPPA